VRKLNNFLLTTTLLLCVSTSAFAKGNVIVVIGDAPGTGFNDPTPAASVPAVQRGNNPGTTLGELRTNALNEAARIWSERLDSKIDIIVRAFFVPRPCTATSATLASAGAAEIWIGVPNARPDFIYGSSLANKLAGEDLHPFAANDATSQEITARFNSNLGNPGCLTGTFWYYGLDGVEGVHVDMVATTIHEMGHGLGFQTFNDRTTGKWPFDENGSYPDPYGALIADTTVGKGWLDMSDAERFASAVNTGHLVFTGSHLDAAFPDILKGTPILRVNAPGAIATTLDVGVADFGGTLGAPEVNGNIVIGNSPSITVPGTNDTLGCSPFNNAADIAGKVLYVDRGTCTFTIKGQNALAAGAIGVVIGDNAPGPPAGLTGSVPGLTAPVVRITQALGAAIKQQIQNLGLAVNVTIGVDTTRRPGVAGGHVRLYAPNPVILGSSTSHFDDVAYPNLIMEPSINKDLGHVPEPPADLTMPVFRDIGWYADEDVDLVADGDDSCQGSSEAATVLGGVPNALAGNGCKLSDRVAACRADGAANHGQFVSCMNVAEAEFEGAGLISKDQAKALHNAVAYDDQK
jgi:hypothetical protein